MKYITYDSFHIELKARKDLTKEDQRLARRILCFAEIQAQIEELIPEELKNKVKIEIT